MKRAMLVTFLLAIAGTCGLAAASPFSMHAGPVTASLPHSNQAMTTVWLVVRSYQLFSKARGTVADSSA